LTGFEKLTIFCSSTFHALLFTLKKLMLQDPADTCRSLALLQNQLITCNSHSTPKLKLPITYYSYLFQYTLNYGIITNKVRIVCSPVKLNLFHLPYIHAKLTPPVCSVHDQPPYTRHNTFSIVFHQYHDKLSCFH
jgi:hypothetical protein